jgi:hypothetical protein
MACSTVGVVKAKGVNIRRFGRLVHIGDLLASSPRNLPRYYKDAMFSVEARSSGVDCSGTHTTEFI